MPGLSGLIQRPKFDHWLLGSYPSSIKATCYTAVALRLQLAVLSPIHRRLLSSSGVMLSLGLLLIAYIDRNSSLLSTCVIIDCMERRCFNYVDIRSEANESYASIWSTISIISIDSNPEDTGTNYIEKEWTPRNWIAHLYLSTVADFFFGWQKNI